MKFFVLAAILAVVAAGPAAPVVNSASPSEAVESEVQPVQPVQAFDLTRLRKSAYGGSSGGSSYQAPPCASNYLFSCKPSLSPAPCSPQSSSYGSHASHGSHGSYSAPVPSYVAPFRNPGYGVPQGYAYNQFY